MPKTYSVLMMGASYGSLLAVKLLAAGHSVRLVCLPAEAEQFNAHGARVLMPVKGRADLVEIDSRKLPGKLSAGGTDGVDPAAFDLVGLAMQEPQYRQPGVRELLDRVARSRTPAMSIMNMPPLPYLKRIPGIDVSQLRHAFADATVWDTFDPATLTLCSPDPQAFRPPEQPVNVLQVSLPTNFKAARFESDAHTQILRDMQAGIEAARFEAGPARIELPVKLKVHDSIFVPLAKWAMLLTGNYRCVMKDGMRPIRDAVHADLARSKEIYDWVRALCVEIGASADDMVPFEKYAQAAQGLAKPSSAARALAAGAQNIERVDLLVQGIARQRGKHLAAIDDTVSLVDAWLAKNRKA